MVGRNVLKIIYNKYSFRVSPRRHPFLDGTDIISILDNSGNIVVK